MQASPLTLRTSDSDAAVESEDGRALGFWLSSTMTQTKCHVLLALHTRFSGYISHGRNLRMCPCHQQTFLDQLIPTKDANRLSSPNNSTNTRMSIHIPDTCKIRSEPARCTFAVPHGNEGRHAKPNWVQSANCARVFTKFSIEKCGQHRETGGQCDSLLQVSGAPMASWSGTWSRGGLL